MESELKIIMGDLMSHPKNIFHSLLEISNLKVENSKVDLEMTARIPRINTA